MKQIHKERTNETYRERGERARARERERERERERTINKERVR